MGLTLSHNERIIAWRLATWHYVTIDDIVRNLYSNRADGGPDDAVGSARVQLWNLRQKLPFKIINFEAHAWKTPGRYTVEDKDALLAWLADEVSGMTIETKAKGTPYPVSAWNV